MVSGDPLLSWNDAVAAVFGAQDCCHAIILGLADLVWHMQQHHMVTCQSSSRSTQLRMAQLSQMACPMLMVVQRHHQVPSFVHA